MSGRYQHGKAIHINQPPVIYYFSHLLLIGSIEQICTKIVTYVFILKHNNYYTNF